MKYFKATIYIQNGKPLTLRISSKRNLHDVEIFEMMTGQFPGYCELTEIDPDLGYEDLKLLHDAYAYTIYRANY